MWPVFVLLLAIFGIGRASGGPDPADLADMSLEELMEIEVTSTSKTPTHLNRAPGTVYSFTGDQLLDEGILTLEDLLRRIPGTQLVPNRSGHTNIWFRGVQNRYNNNILLIVDSVPVRDFVYGNFLIDEMYPIEQIDRIEILLGPGSVLYGANAQAGIITITTKRHANEILGMATTFDSYSGSMHVGHKKLSAFVKYLETHSGFDPELGRDGRERRWPQDQDRRLSVFDVQYDVWEDLTLKLSKTRHAYPYPYSKYNRSQVQFREPLTLSMNYKHGTLEEGRFDVVAYYVDYDFDEEAYRVTGSLTPRELKLEAYHSEYYGMDAYYSKRFDAHTLLFGTSLLYHRATDGAIRQDIDLRNPLPEMAKYGATLQDPDRMFTDYAFYVQDQWSVTENLDLTFGARYDKPEGFDKEWSFRFAAVRTLGEDWFVKFLVGTSFRTPTYREFRKTDPDGTALFDESLAAEQMKTYEVSIGRRTKKHNSWLLTGFYNKFTDFIADEYDAGLDDEIFHNYSERVTQGIELSGNLWLIPKALDLRGGITYVNGRDKAIRDEFHGLSNWLGYASFRYQYDKKLSFGVSANYASRPHVDEAYQTESDTQDAGLNKAILTFGADIRYALNEHTDLQLIGRNITNRKYYSPHFGPSSDYDYEWPGAEFLFVIRSRW